MPVEFKIINTIVHDTVNQHAGDFNGDNYIDLIIVNTYTNDLSVLLNYGNGTFEKQMTVKTANYPGYLTHGILNDNNRLDIINARATDKHISITLNTC
ncbi:unnamed protein product [Adineta steineri]|uniref:VCBS repeat-containing protein n=1 Tax=Adineta steineri TaxID=433720 RepID=A0A813RBH2_9BILA|nr:unnamed protein product [Adineta steineri]